MARAAFTNSTRERSRACLKRKSVAELEQLAQVATQSAYWRILLGSVYALLSFGKLLPLALSLLFGAAKGSTIASSVNPYSRVPAIVTSSAAVFTFPFVVQVAVLVQSLLGNWVTLVGILFLLLGIVCSMKPRDLRASTGKELMKRQTLMSRISLISLLVSMLIFAIALFISDLAQVTYDVLSEQDITLSEKQMEQMASQVLWVFFSAVAGVLGKSLISTVFFSDLVVELMQKFHDGEIHDSMTTICKRTTLVQEMRSIFWMSEQQQRGSKVAPSDVEAVGDDPDLESMQSTMEKQIREAMGQMQAQGAASFSSADRFGGGASGAAAAAASEQLTQMMRQMVIHTQSAAAMGANHMKRKTGAKTGTEGAEDANKLRQGAVVASEASAMDRAAAGNASGVRTESGAKSQVGQR